MTGPRRIQVDISVREMPDGRDGVLMQFETGYLITGNADSIDELAGYLVDAANELRRRQQTIEAVRQP